MFEASDYEDNFTNVSNYISFDDSNIHTAQSDGYIVIKANASKIASAYIYGRSLGSLAIFSKDQTSSVAYIKKGMRYQRRDSSSLGNYEFYPLTN